MLQTLNCIRMGEVLVDENLQIFILCNNCHTDLRNVHDFRQHLEKCEGLENLFKDGQQLKYNTDKSTQLFGKTLKGIKEFLVYDYCDVEMSYTKQEDNFIDLINIEEELLNPKWYSDLNAEVSPAITSNQKSAKQYDELVEAVTPFVQFKENVKANNNGSRKTSLNKTPTDTTVMTKLNTDKSIKTISPINKKLPIKRRLVTKSGPIQLEPSVVTQGNIATITAALNQTPPTTVQVSKTFNSSKKRKTDPIIYNGAATKPIEIHHPHHQSQILTQTPPMTKPKVNHNKSLTTPTNKMTNDLNSINQKSLNMPSSIIKPGGGGGPTKEKQTAQILNKLQNLGLQVKRTQPIPPPLINPNATAAASKTDTKTMEILQKLQSKGMKVKILNKQQTTTTMAKPSLPPSAVVSNKLIPSVIRNPAANMAIKQNLNKNLIIRKVN